MSKRLEYTRHALEQREERGITDLQVRWLLDKGRVCDAWTPSGASAKRYARCGFLGNREAKVVYIENEVRVLAITVMWVHET